MLKKVMVANRGEIALRVFRACKELGIKTVAVYSDADSTALFARYADEKFHIGPAAASESYLRIDKLIEIAVSNGVDGIHPGYGFLAENVEFARAVKNAGIEFIGPPIEAMELMCSKIDSKKAMKEAGVHVVPGVTEAISDHERAKEIAQEIGYPVMLKASAGGGGIGIQMVQNNEDMIETLGSVKRLAKSSFGDDSVFIEKYIPDPRHIEYQIMGDKHGNIIHLYERECSVQRRHQKIIEETPSCALSPELREEMGKQAVLVARTANYYNAGTCEFMFKDGKYYFLEMNTRLQVEHPITEITTGVDLVREQIRVASGLELEYTQQDIKPKGHAFECRINAEDPLNNFMPSPDKIINYAEPSGPGIRLDSGVYKGYTIPPNYDSMISKLIIWDENRPRAVSRALRALWEYQISGVETNIPLHELILQNDVFLGGEYDTAFLEKTDVMEKIGDYVASKKDDSHEKKVAAAMAAVSAILHAYSKN